MGTRYAREELLMRRAQVCVVIRFPPPPPVNGIQFFEKTILVGIILSVIPAEGILGHGSNLTFGTTDVDGLKGFVAECRRLKDTVGTYSLAHSYRQSLDASLLIDRDPTVNLANSTTNFIWLRHYFAKRTTINARKYIRKLFDFFFHNAHTTFAH